MKSVNRKFFACVKHREINSVIAALARGVNVRAKNDYVLRWRSEQGYLEMITILLEHGADLHAKNDGALTSGVEYNHLNVVTELLERGANIHAGDDRALRLAVQNNNLSIVTKLLECGANIFCNDEQILKNLSVIFDGSLDAIILPYCNPTEYHYFPADYVEDNIMQTKVLIKYEKVDYFSH